MALRRDNLFTLLLALCAIIPNLKVSDAGKIGNDDEDVSKILVKSRSTCYNEPDGSDYTGTVSTTATGLQCQSWSELYPHWHKLYRPYSLLGGHNYCRNPGNSGTAPWCYTTDPDIEWEYCFVGFKQQSCYSGTIECYEDGAGRDYIGLVSETITGLTCQRWDVQTPHPHPYHMADKLDNNYCRNPSFSDRPWCYTTDPDIQWQYCDVCGNGQGLETNVAINKAASQSSLQSANKATDGVKSTSFGDGSCTQTNSEESPWWKVDLEHTYFVTEVVITNRRDCCPERLEGAVVRVGPSDDHSRNRQCGEAVSSQLATGSAAITIKCAGNTVGRYVSVQLERINQQLTLCEVEVRGLKAELWGYNGRCGPFNPVIANVAGECNPNSVSPCCSPFGWCGSSTEYCDCPSCIDYRNVDA